jgi:hypothetical protein
MRIPISRIVNENYIRRTERLLRLVRRKFGPETHLLVKKILLVSLYVDYYQEISKSHRWVGYVAVLSRNEGIALNNTKTPTMFISNEERFLVVNNVGFTFLGIPGKLIKDCSVPLSMVEDAAIKYCKETISQEVWPF